MTPAISRVAKKLVVSRWLDLLFYVKISDQFAFKPTGSTSALIFMHHVIGKLETVGCVAQLAESRSLAGELTLSCARPAADG